VSFTVISLGENGCNHGFNVKIAHRGLAQAAQPWILLTPQQ